MTVSEPNDTSAPAREVSEKHLSKTYAIKVNGEERRIGTTFYRGETANYMPWRRDMEKPNAIVDFILKGWMPEAPFIEQDTRIVAFGSCFAANIGRYLAAIGFDVSTRRDGAAYIQRIGDGLVNVFAIRQQFEWAWENRVPEVELWHGWKAEEYGYDEEVRLATKKLFDEADVFILTFGLSEIWYDEPTGEVFWRAVPSEKFDPSRHKFRLATYEETIDGMRQIHALIRKNWPSAKIIFTLSPIALAATFRPISCITASTVSKAILRTAIDVLHREVTDSNFYYFPAYEVVKEGFVFGFGEDRRHPDVHVLDCNMKAFERYFCKTGLTDDDLQETISKALEMESLLLGADGETRAKLMEGRSEEWRDQLGAGLKNIEKAVLRKRIISERQAGVDARREAKANRIAARQQRLDERQQKSGEKEARRAERTKRIAR